MTPRWRAALGEPALVFGSMAFVLFLLEAGLRLTGFVPERERAVRRMVDARWRTLLDCFPSNPRGYFDIDLRRPENARYRRLAPARFDAMTRHHPWAVESRYNALRFRDAELGPKPPGVKRVVAFTPRAHWEAKWATKTSPLAFKPRRNTRNEDAFLVSPGVACSLGSDDRLRPRA